MLERLTDLLAAGSEVVHTLRRALEKVGPQGAPVLIAGESGRGQELIARALHALSPRAAGPFVAISVALPGLERALFGDADGDGAPGSFELAGGGTLFLDGVDGLEPGLQVRLLRALQHRVVERVGSSAPLPVDVRLVCATHGDLRALVAAGRFRSDLYWRLAVVPLPLPPRCTRPAAGSPAPLTLAAARDAFEREFIQACLARHGGNVTRAARELDVPRSTIYRKLRGWGEPDEL